MSSQHPGEYPEYPADGTLPPPVYPQPTGYPPGYSPSPGYRYGPYHPMKPPGTNGLAIAALVSSVLGVACCGLTCIVGVVLGVIAMRDTRRTGQDGYGIALAGTIVGGLMLAGWLVYLLIYIGILASGWQWTP